MEPGEVIELNSWDWGCSTTEINTVSVNEDLWIYPNPSQNFFICESTSKGQIQVFNSIGQIECSLSKFQTGQMIFGEELEPGYYIVIFTNTTTDTKTVSRIVKH